MVGEVGGDGLGEEVEGVLFAWAAGFQDGEQGLDEAAAGVAWGAEAELFPAISEAPLRDDRMAQRAFGGVVVTLEQARAGGCGGVVGAAGSVF